MSPNKSVDQTMRIAPKSTCGYWTVGDWVNAYNADDWDSMYMIFKNRLEFRYFDAIQGLIGVDVSQPTRRFGFSIMALDCLLIETLAQFYLGIKTSEE